MILSLPVELIDEIAIHCLQIDYTEDNLDYGNEMPSMNSFYAALNFPYEYCEERMDIYFKRCEGYFVNQRFIDYIYELFYHDLYILETKKRPKSKVSNFIINYADERCDNNIDVAWLWFLVKHRFKSVPNFRRDMELKNNACFCIFRQIKTCDLLANTLYTEDNPDWLELMEVCYPVCMSYLKALNMINLFK